MKQMTRLPKKQRWNTTATSINVRRGSRVAVIAAIVVTFFFSHASADDAAAMKKNESSQKTHTEENRIAEIRLGIVRSALEQLLTLEIAESPDAKQSATFPLNMDRIIKEIAAAPQKTRWAGKYDQTYWGVAIVPFPDNSMRKRSRPLIRQRSILQSLGALLFLKTHDDYVASDVFPDKEILLRSLAAVFAESSIQGKCQKTFEHAFEQDEWIVGFMSVKEDHLTVELTERQDGELVGRYAALEHRKIQGLMERKEWEKAIEIWNVLFERGIVTEQLFFDAIRSQLALDRRPEAAATIRETLQRYDALSLEDCVSLRELAKETNDEKLETIEQTLIQRIEELTPKPPEPEKEPTGEPPKTGAPEGKTPEPSDDTEGEPKDTIPNPSKASARM